MIDTILQTANNEKREIASLGKGVAGIRHDAVGVDIRERHIWHAVLAAIAIACMTITEGDGNAEKAGETCPNPSEGGGQVRAFMLNFGGDMTTGIVNEELIMKNEEGLARRPEGESQSATATE